MTNTLEQRKLETKVEHGPFDLALAKLSGEGYDIISAAQNAQLRIQDGRYSRISLNGNYIREGVIYIPNDKPRLVRFSPILSQARATVDLHKKDKELCVSRQYLDSIFDIYDDSIVLPDKDTSIPTNRFADEEVTRWLFRGEAREYGEFLRSAKVDEMFAWVAGKDYVDKKGEAFARSLWLSSIGGKSSINCNSMHNFSSDQSVCGVRKAS